MVERRIVLVLVSVLLICSIAFARTSYWGEYEDEMVQNLSRPGRLVESFTSVLSLAVDEIANDMKWMGTRKECHDLFRNYLAEKLGIIPPANWDANVSNVQDAAVDFMHFLDNIVVNNRVLTQTSKDSILSFATTNAEFVLKEDE